MSEETQAAPSTAVDPFEGKQVSMVEYDKYRHDGELPDRFKAETAAPAAADEPEETDKPEGESPEPAPESDPEESQELKPKTARRIAQLLADKKELERKLAEKTDVKTESSPTPAPQHAHPKPTADDTKPDGTPKYAAYEDFVEALGVWAAKEERAKWESETAQKRAQEAIQSKLNEARARYKDADDVIFPTERKLMDAQIPQMVKQVFGDSDVYVDLCYVIGSDPAELEKFVDLARTNPRAAIGMVFEYERGIREELSTPRDDKGKFTETKRTSAPKPPAPVGGASSRAFDVSDESLSPEAWARKRTADLARR